MQLMSKDIVSQLESELETFRGKKSGAEESRRRLESEIRLIEVEMSQLVTALEVLRKRGFKLERPIQPEVRAAAESMLQATVTKRVKILTALLTLSLLSCKQEPPVVKDHLSFPSGVSA